MSWLTLGDIAEMAGGRLVGHDASVTSVSTDTRSLSDGALFVALKGPNFDGHHFVAQALDSGAAAALVSEAVDAEIPQVVVEDTRLALGRLASAWRDRLGLPVIALTGSNGKTTVKEMIASIMSTKGSVLATRGNLNNDIGVPLTLLSIRAHHQYAVIEMGANHLEEIRYLAQLAKPNIGLVNNAGPAHLEGFGDLDGVARGKGELFECLAPGATAILNADDAYFDYWSSLLEGKQVISFGGAANADVRAELDDEAFFIEAGGERMLVSLPVPGRHNRMNALAAAASCMAAGATLAEVRQGLEGLDSVAGRLNERAGLNGSVILDDTYNANPASFRAGIEVLAEHPGTRILVLGDMGELGEETERLHAEVGVFARDKNLDQLMGVGDFASGTVSAFGSGGRHYADKSSLVADLKRELKAGVTALIKGSRSMAMEEVVNAVVRDVNTGREGAGHAA